MNNDLISREALLKAMEEERQYLLARGQRGAEHILVHHCLPLIDNAPTVEITEEQAIDKLHETGWLIFGKDMTKLLTGEWIYHPEHLQDNNIPEFTCSICGVEQGKYYNFCGNCGIKMKGGETNE